ncbi:MAG TPA: YihY/virulence factor BrkB family protein [Nocardioides sp.]|nr:YihY/virulence factor BrkB family protein [Nocardioides sp.]
MAGIKQRLEDARERSALLDHVLRTVEHYGSVNGSQQAAGVTYFGFLSVFPVLALAFFVIGYVARVVPTARDTLVSAISQILPGLVGTGPNQIQLADIENSAGAVGLIGLAGVLYAGLGWLSALQTALIAVFEEPRRLRPNFIMGKLRDLSALAVLGVVLLAGVAASGVIGHSSGWLLDELGLSGDLGWVVTVLAVVVGVAAGTLMFFLMFVLLAHPRLPRRAVAKGALLAAVGFEVLKQASTLLLASTKGQPAFQAFGIALILLVWINYFSQVTLYAAAWAQTSRTRPAPDLKAMISLPVLPAVSQVAERPQPGRGGPFAAGAGAMLALVVLLKRTRRHHP